MASQWPNQNAVVVMGWGGRRSTLSHSWYSPGRKLFCSQQHNFISLMTKVSCLYYLIVEKLNESAIPAPNSSSVLLPGVSGSLGCTGTQAHTGGPGEEPATERLKAAPANVTLTLMRNTDAMSVHHRFFCGIRSFWPAVIVRWSTTVVRPSCLFSTTSPEIIGYEAKWNGSYVRISLIFWYQNLTIIGQNASS